MLAAKIAVRPPMMATNSAETGARAYSTWLLATMYTPAVTIVAAWISALTGVGPSIASGSQTYRGIWADLPIAPTNRQSVMTVRRAVLTSGARGKISR